MMMTMTTLTMMFTPLSSVVVDIVCYDIVVDDDDDNDNTNDDDV